MSHSSLAKQLKVFAIILLILGVVGTIWLGIDTIDNASSQSIDISSMPKPYKKLLRI